TIACSVHGGLDRDGEIQVGTGYLQGISGHGKPNSTQDRQGSASARYRPPSDTEGLNQDITFASQLHRSAFPTSYGLDEILFSSSYRCCELWTTPDWCRSDGCEPTLAFPRIAQPCDIGDDSCGWPAGRPPELHLSDTALPEGCPQLGGNTGTHVPPLML